MSLTNYVTHFLLTTLAFFAIDIVWLGVIARGLYQKYLSKFLAPNVNWSAAIIFYLLFIVGILIFAVYPAAEKNSLSHALLYGGLFGFFTYATYDLTNLATLNNWPIQIVFIDIVWGVLLTASVSAVSFYILKFTV